MTTCYTNRSRRRLLVSALLATALSAHAQLTFWDVAADRQRLPELLSQMSDQELLGQVFFLGFPGPRMTAYLERWIRERHLGGVKIFTRNVDGLETLAANNDAMQAAARRSRRQIPLLIATDQEGGWVRHVKYSTSITPGNLGIGATGLPDDAYRTGRYIGGELAALGINMNFAPTIDVYTSPAATVIGPRAFSSDPVQTGLLAVAFYRGLQSSGIIATAKHFPGHGAADRDSHGHLPTIDASLEQIWARELVPYRFLIREGLPAIMSGHLAYPRITGGPQPSSLSAVFQNDLLRTRLGFAGVVVTDDLEMAGALAVGASPAEAAVQALQAGNDMLLISHTPAWQERAWDLALRRMATDPDFREQVAVAARRVLELKRSAFTATPPAPLRAQLDRLDQLVPRADAAQFFFDSAARAVTVLRDAAGAERNRRLPLTAAAAGRTLIVGQIAAFLAEGQRRFPAADTAQFPYSPFYFAVEPHLSRIPELAADYDTVIFGLSNYNSMQVLERLEPLADRVVVMSALTPVYLEQTPWVSTALAVYGTGADSFRAGFAVLAGDYVAGGRAPVEFNGGTPAPGRAEGAASAAPAGAPR